LASDDIKKNLIIGLPEPEIPIETFALLVLCTWFLNRDLATSGLAAVILNFERRSTSHNIVLDSIGVLDPVNLIETFGISALSATEADILLLPVQRPPS
jgi:hypothetical protein